MFPRMTLGAAATTFGERVILGNLLYLDPADPFVDQVLGMPEAVFTDSRNRCVLGAIRALRRAGQGTDVATVINHLGTTGQLTRVGGDPYLLSLTDTSLVVEAKTDHLEHLHAAWRRREAAQLIAALQERVSLGADPLDAATALRDAVAGLGGLDGGADLMVAAHTPVAVTEILDRRRGSRTGIPTGWPELDALTGGWHPQELITVGARAGAGKSVAVLGFAAAAAGAGYGTILFTPEMSANEVMMRLIAAQAMLPYTPMYRGEPFYRDDEDRSTEADTRMFDAADAIAEWPFAIADGSSISMSDIRRITATFKRDRERQGAAHPLSVVVVDYLGLVTPEPGKGREMRHEQVSSMIRDCKIMAGQMNCTVIIACQLNRGAATATRMPTMSELKESGGYEEHSNVVLLLHRGEAIDPAAVQAPIDPDLHVIVPKNRSGPQSEFTRAWYGRYMATGTMSHPQHT